MPKKRTSKKSTSPKPNYPVWDAQDKPKSLRVFAEFLHGLSRQVFLEDKAHEEMFFLLTDTKILTLLRVDLSMTRQDVICDVKRWIREENLYAVIHIFAGISYFPKGENDHTLRQLQSGEMTLDALKEEDRFETLSVDVQSRDGQAYAFMDEIVRQGSKLAFGASREKHGMVNLNVGKLFE